MLLLGSVLAACQSPRQALEQLAQQHAQRLRVIDGPEFPLLVGTPARIPATTRLRVYLEGDGHAWATRSQPSLDPTPHNLLVARLAFSDPQPSVYLARPCQFVRSAACENSLWTGQRFSARVVGSLDKALDRLKADYHNRDFELVGYSGGAALALLLAARRDDIAQVQTLAGNLSPREWARVQQLTPLSGSLEPLDQRERLAQIPQRHLLGREDRVIPALLLEYYRQALGPAPCVETALLPAVSHDQGWEAAWTQWRARPLTCLPSQP